MIRSRQTALSLTGLLCLLSFSAQASVSSQRFWGQLRENASEVGLHNWHPEPVRQREPASPGTSLTLQQLGRFEVDSSMESAVRDVLQTFPARHRPFILAMSTGAIRLQEAFGIPASVTVAMAIYESAYGRSELARFHSNYFGIKAFPTWQGDRVRMKTKDEGTWTEADFRVYPNYREGMLGFANFLSTAPRYQSAFAVTDPAEFARRILDAGYCPDDDYHTNILSIIKRYDLTKLDLPQA